MNKINLGGRPLKFTPIELKDLLQKYLNDTPKDDWTVTGLALLIGSRQLLDDYQKRKGYSGIITEAKLLVENGYEIDCKKHGRSGSIFVLKNFGWKDKNETDITTQGERIEGFNFVKPTENEKVEK